MEDDSAAYQEQQEEPDAQAAAYGQDEDVLTGTVQMDGAQSTEDIAAFSETPSPSKEEEGGLTAIEDVDPTTQHAEGGSNPMAPHEDDHAGVIASYTQGEHGQAGSEDFAEGGEGDDRVDAQVAEAQPQAEYEDLGADEADAGTNTVGDYGYEAEHQQHGGAGPTTADASTEADAAYGEPDQRPTSAHSQHQASTSRPASARPTSARPASARPTSARPASGSVRPPSGSARPPSANMPAPVPEEAEPALTSYMQQQEQAMVAAASEAAAGAAAAAAPLSADMMRSGSSQSADARPGSRTGSQEAAAPPNRRPVSREVAGGGLPPTIAEEPRLPQAQIEHYIASGLKAIDVELEQGPGMPHRMLRVLMDYTQCDRKPYLGGFRNKRTGVVYHHAGTQTPRAPKYSEADRKLSRETQTVQIKQRSIQTFREQATQMERPGYLPDTTTDRVVMPGKYQTADERDEIVLRAVMRIQRWARGWLGRRRAAYLRSKKAEREAFLRQQELKAQQEAEEHRRREIQRRMHPRTAADFEVLYNELEAWRLQETRKIKEAGLPKEQEQAVLQQLLHKETKLLQTIDRLKINANHENKELRVQHTLNEMAKPKKFALRNGGKVEVHTPFTTRAKELQQLYNGLNLPMLTVDERLDVLLHVKWTVKEFDCDLTREVVELIDREADLLNRGRNPKMLEGLRKRISSLFLNFIETPEFNPEAVRFQIVPMDFESYLFENVGKATAKVQTLGATANSIYS